MSALTRLATSPLRFAPFLLALICLIAVIVVTRPPESNSTTNYYVQTDGDDANDGSISRPWRSIQKAVDSAATGSSVLIGSGDYAPFAVTRPDMTIAAVSGATVTVRGRPDTRDVILLSADNLTLSDITVEGCVPNPAPAGFEDNGSSGVRIDSGTYGVDIARITVREGRGSTPDGRRIGCYGVIIHEARNATVVDSRMYQNGYGVFVRNSEYVRVLGNDIYDNDVLIRNTVDPDDDFGAVGVGFDSVTDALAQGNTIRGNAGPSLDYGTDGAAFEIFQSSRITMTENVLANNETILETGTRAGGECRSNSFTHNTATGRTAGSELSRSSGLLLRCGRDMTVTDNDVSGVDLWTFYVTGGDRFSSSVAGLELARNTVMQGSSPVYVFDLDPNGQDFTVDGNAFQYLGPFARDWNRNILTSLGQWQQRTGFDLSSSAIQGRAGR